MTDEAGAQADAGWRDREMERMTGPIDTIREAIIDSPVKRRQSAALAALTEVEHQLATHGWGSEWLALEARAVAAETALAEANRELCPVCGHNDWDIDYDYNGEDEMQVNRCANCQWPPTYPATVMAWKRRHFVSPYINDLETALKAAEQRANDLADALRQIADGSWHIPGPGHHTTASFARAALDRQEQT